MISANIIEPGAKILLRNNIVTQNASNVWKNGTGYNFFHYEYEIPIRKGHYYYAKATYKYTTTNQKPATFSMYLIGGMFPCFEGIAISEANTEYTVSQIVQDDRMFGRNGTLSNSRWSSNIYHNPYTGATGYVKDLILYDVTELYQILKANSIAPSISALKTWCDNNLVWAAAYTNYDITSKVNNSLTSKIAIDGDFLCSNLVETDGMCYYSATTDFKSIEGTYFDVPSNISIYNNNSNGTVTAARTSDSTNPFYPQHKYVLEVNTNGSASPGLGGIVSRWYSRANEIVIEKIVAKIPIGYKLSAFNNSLGNNYSKTYLSDMNGTGKWEEYAILYKCGNTGTFSTSGFLALETTSSSSSTTSVTWYIAYIQFADITGNEYLKNYSVMPNKEIIDINNTFTYKFDSQNLCVNGDGGNTSILLPSSNYKWNKSVITGDAKASIEWIKGAGANDTQLLVPKVAIDPSSKYKISLWIKSKADMSAFYLAVQYYTAGGTQLRATNVSYINGTKTQLTKALTAGDTQIEVSSNANWKARSYSYLGFRNNLYHSSYCDRSPYRVSNGYTGIVKGTSGSNIVTLNTAYSGTTVPSGTVIVEGFDEYTFKYIAFKSTLKADAWVKVEATVGNDGFMWDGSGGGWYNIPFDAAYMSLCGSISANNGSDSVYFADIKIEEVGIGCLGKRENKIQIQRLDK